MTNEQSNKQTVRRFFKAFESNDETVLRDILAPDLVAYAHNQNEPQNREEHVAGILMWNAAFAATRFDIEDQVAEGDRVVTLLRMRATHSLGEFQGRPPTGNQIDIAGASIDRVRDGKLVERRVISDWLGMLQQLGLIPAASGA